MTNLTSRKELAAKVLGVGKNKILFDVSRIDDIKEAITKQDIRDLYADGAISTKENSGRKSSVKRNTRRGPGKIKLTVRTPKRDYVFLVRKLRSYLEELRKQGKVDEDKFFDLRRKIKAGLFKSKTHFKEHLSAEIKNIKLKA